MLLASLQDLLARFYNLQVDADISDFLVTDKQLCDGLHEDFAENSEEMLFLAEENGNLDISVYLDDMLLQRLTSSMPETGLSAENLDDFCKVLEGVSHFVYLVWNAVHGKRVTLLELELQAEVDKYVSTRLWLQTQYRHRFMESELVDSLFARVSYRDELAREQLDRYRYANDMCGRYCHSLTRRFPGAGNVADMMLELRDFYRMPQPDKFSHMHTRQFA